MTKAGLLSPTAFSVGSWTTKSELPQLNKIRTTMVTSPSKGRVILAGTQVGAPDGSRGLSVNVDPSSVARKIAIRQINDEQEGRASVFDAFTPGMTESGR